MNLHLVSEQRISTRWVIDLPEVNVQKTAKPLTTDPPGQVETKMVTIVRGKGNH